MKRIFAALCALGLASASLWIRYDLLALGEPQLHDKEFLLSAGLVLFTLLLFLDSIFSGRGATTVPSESEEPSDIPVYVDHSQELSELREQLAESESQRKTFEAALRDVEGRLAVEQNKKTQSVAATEVEAQVVQFLSQLQERGRFVDFLMQDVQTFSDEQVGRAARVVHQGCRTVVQELFTLTPVTSDAEGQTVSVDAGEADRFRLVGSISGTPPYRGRLLHRGWRTAKVNLPTRVEKALHGTESLPGYVVVPAEVELSV